MAISKAAVTILSSNSSAAGTSTKAAPSITGALIPCSSYYGGEIMYKISNSSSAPTVACSLTFQISSDGTNWYDYYTVGGDNVASSITSGAILLDRGVMNLRVIAYGNVTNAVTVEAFLQAVTGV